MTENKALMIALALFLYGTALLYVLFEDTMGAVNTIQSPTATPTPYELPDDLHFGPRVDDGATLEGEV